MGNTSLEVAKYATRMAISSREEEEELKSELRKKGIIVTAVNIGGNINDSTSKILDNISFVFKIAASHSSIELPLYDTVFSKYNKYFSFI